MSSHIEHLTFQDTCTNVNVNIMEIKPLSIFRIVKSLQWHRCKTNTRIPLSLPVELLDRTLQCTFEIFSVRQEIVRKTQRILKDFIALTEGLLIWLGFLHNVLALLLESSEVPKQGRKRITAQ